MFDSSLNSLEQNADFFAACHPQYRACRPSAPGTRPRVPGLLLGALAFCWSNGLFQACRQHCRNR